MPEVETFSLQVNGREVRIAAGRDTPLLYILRNDLELTGARFGCGDGVCGACTVLIDERAMNSCDVPLWAAEGKSIFTVEGLSGAAGMRRLQEIVIEEQAAQCGYCLPGIMMRVEALCQDTETPSRDDMLVALDHSLCRCGAHARILRAMERYIGERAEQAGGRS